MIIIYNDTQAMGDCLRSLTGTISLARHYQNLGHRVAVSFSRKDIESIFNFGHHGILTVDELLSWSGFNEQIETFKISWNDQTLGRSPLPSNMDFNAAVSAYFHIPVAPLQDWGEDNPSAQIYVPDMDVPQYDIIIAPYVLNNAYKNMHPTFWQNLVNKLVDKGMSVAVIGSTVMPSDDQLRKIEHDINRFKGDDYITYNFSEYLIGVHYETNIPMIRTCNLLNKMRYCMISPDSGPSHLINKLMRPHIEFHPHQNVMISKFSFFNQRTELGRPIVIQDVLDRIHGMFS